MKLSFKKHKRETGLRGVGNPNPDTSIKADGAFVGTIVAPSWRSKDNRYCIRFMVKNPDETRNCPFSWMTLKARFETEEAAKEFVKRVWKDIQGHYALLPDPDFKPWEY